MHLLIEYLILAACLLGVVALIQVVAMRLPIPEATVLSLFGIAIGASYFAIVSLAPDLAQFFLAPLINPALPPDAFVWLFLPPLVCQAALATDVRDLVQDAAAILLLAVVAVVVATAVIGVALSALVPFGLVACLLLGAIVGETDAAAVIAVFRDVGAPARLIRLVEGDQSLRHRIGHSLAGQPVCDSRAGHSRRGPLQKAL
jgi:CPA1 family monovalent cation:H+ antiporter